MSSARRRWPGLRADLQQLVADLVDRLVPGKAIPRAVHELHRKAHATFTEHVVAHGRSLAAVRATIDRGVPARLLPGPHAIGDLGNHRAADRAMRADVLAPRHNSAGRRRRAGLSLADSPDRQGAERGQSASNEAGTAQKAAAIEIAGGRGRECWKRAAGRLLLCSLDQHQDLLHLAG